MIRRHPMPAIAVGALLGATVACGGARGGAAVPPAPTGATASAGAARATDAGIARARADSLRLPWTAADARFMTHMIHHHSQAIVMARLAPTHDASPTVRTLADRIINAQQDEIATMQRWLRDRLQPVPEPDTARATGAMGGSAAAGTATGTATGGAHAHHGGAATPAAGAMGGMASMDHASMPGMLTAAQLRELDAARGGEFDRLFLTYMIQHHRGATQMVRELFGTYGAAQDETVFKFASDVNVDQTTEIARMQRMLAAITALGAP
jgi:uncharacterized protein (DUF305 family)